MGLRRCTRPVDDGAIAMLEALLYNDEEIHASQDGVGIYDGHVFNLFLQTRQFSLGASGLSVLHTPGCRVRCTTLGVIGFNRSEDNYGSCTGGEHYCGSVGGDGRGCRGGWGYLS
jgi:hypothetical protein